MKKLLLIFTTVIMLTSFMIFVGCKKPIDLTNYVSELKSNVYEGDNTENVLKASFGYSEKVMARDGKVGDRVYGLTFRLIGKESLEVEYSICFKFNEQEKTSVFALDPVSHKMTAFIETGADFNQPEFTVTLKSANEQVDVKMTSIVPKDTISSSSALDNLYINEPDLVNHYIVDGEFNAEIIERIVIKGDKSYWYIGFATPDGQLKALLVDGKTGEVLAIRQVIG